MGTLGDDNNTDCYSFSVYYIFRKNKATYLFLFFENVKMCCYRVSILLDFTDFNCCYICE